MPKKNLSNAGRKKVWSDEIIVSFDVIYSRRGVPSLSRHVLQLYTMDPVV